MNDIICPNCKKAFKVDEAGFAAEDLTIKKLTHGNAAMKAKFNELKN